MKKPLLLIACMAVALSVQARMGYGNMDVVRNYGKPQAGSSEDGKQLVYRIDGFELTCFMSGGKVVGMIYRKPGKYSNESILKTERERIVQLNADGHTWAPMECPREYADQHLMSDLWRRSDGAIACYNWRNNSLTILRAGLDHLIFDDGTKSTSGL